MENNEEAKQLDQAIEALPESNHSPADIAAAFFTMNQTKLVRSLNALSLRALRRMVLNVAAYPTKGQYNPRDENERTAAYLFHEMMFNKSIMQLQVEAEKIEKANLEQTNKEGENTNVQETT